MESNADRLKKARADAGYDSAQDAIDAFGFPASGYRHHENGTRAFLPHSAKRYGQAFKVNPAWLLGLDTKLAPVHVEEVGSLLVEGAVAAGIWREQTEWPEDEKYEIEVGPSPIPGAERFAVRMEGLSMDKTIPPGSDLECLRIVDFGTLSPEPGQLVIASRTMHDLTELTCKRLAKEGANWVLRAESTRPEFQESIVLGKPDKNLFIDNEYTIVGIVVRSHQSHFKQAN